MLFGLLFGLVPCCWSGAGLVLFGAVLFAVLCAVWSAVRSGPGRSGVRADDALDAMAGERRLLLGNTNGCALRRHPSMTVRACGDVVPLSGSMY